MKKCEKKFILFVYRLRLGCSHTIGLACKVFQTLTNIFKHNRLNLMFIGELGLKATKILKKI